MIFTCCSILDWLPGHFLPDWLLGHSLQEVFPARVTSRRADSQVLPAGLPRLLSTRQTPMSLPAGMTPRSLRDSQVIPCSVESDATPHQTDFWVISRRISSHVTSCWMDIRITSCRMDSQASLHRMGLPGYTSTDGLPGRFLWDVRTGHSLLD